MEVTYRKNLSGSYMCVEEDGETAQKYELHMLEGHHISGFLQLQTSVLEGKRRYLYDISGKQQIADYLSGRKIDYQLLQTILFSIQKVCASAREYLLREDGICLKMDFIYVNLEDGSLQFTYLPFYHKNLAKAFVECMEQFLRQIDHQDQAATELAYQIYQLCIQENANIRNILRISMSDGIWSKQEHEQLGEDCQSKSQEYNNKNQQQEAQVYTEQIENIEKTTVKKRHVSDKLYSGNAQNKENTAKKKTDKQRKKEPFLTDFLKNKISEWKAKIPNIIQREENREAKARVSTIDKKKSKQLFSMKSFHQQAKKGYNKNDNIQKPKQMLIQEREAYQQSFVQDNHLLRPTEILCAPVDKPLGKLIYQGIGQCENFTIEREIFLIGKNCAQVDGVIQSEGVSRLHAKIYTQEGQFYIEDLNSTNGTYLNDEVLEYHQPRQLSRGDRVRFGAEEYLFS